MNIEELKQDKASLEKQHAALIVQIHAVEGALAYISGKIEQAEKQEEQHGTSNFAVRGASDDNGE